MADLRGGYCAIAKSNTGLNHPPLAVISGTNQMSSFSRPGVPGRTHRKDAFVAA